MSKTSRKLPELPPINPDRSMNLGEYLEKTCNNPREFGTIARNSVLKGVVLQEIEKRPRVWKTLELRTYLENHHEYCCIAIDVWKRTGVLLTVGALHRYFKNAKDTLRTKLRKNLLIEKRTLEETEANLWRWDAYPHMQYLRANTAELEQVYIKNALEGVLVVSDNDSDGDSTAPDLGFSEEPDVASERTGSPQSDEKLSDSQQKEIKTEPVEDDSEYQQSQNKIGCVQMPQDNTDNTLIAVETTTHLTIQTEEPIQTVTEGTPGSTVKRKADDDTILDQSPPVKRVPEIEESRQDDIEAETTSMRTMSLDSPPRTKEDHESCQSGDDSDSAISSGSSPTMSESSDDEGEEIMSQIRTVSYPNLSEHELTIYVNERRHLFVRFARVAEKNRDKVPMIRKSIFNTLFHIEQNAGIKNLRERFSALAI